jgi:hypothetical protein
MKNTDPRPGVPEQMLENRQLFMNAHRLFHKIFRQHFTDYQDLELTVYFLRPILDLQKFDDWLHGRFGEYEAEGLSMCDVLAREYGETVAMQVKGLLG